MQVHVPVTDRLAALRRTVEEARAMPMSASAVVNRTEVLGMLDDLERAMGEASAESDRVLAQRDGIIGEAESRADQIVKDAHFERDRLVSDTEVYRVATRQAEKLLADARVEANGLRKETDDYVDSRLATFEITLERTIEAVRRGRERLAGRSALDTWGGDDVDAIRLPAHLED
jgi:cell division septum initiation protein DivIVA